MRHPHIISHIMTALIGCPVFNVRPCYSSAWQWPRPRRTRTSPNARYHPHSMRSSLLRGQDEALFLAGFQMLVPNHADAGIPAQGGVIVVRGTKRFGLLVPAQGVTQQLIGHKATPRPP